MEHIPILNDLLVVYGFSAVVVYLFHKLNQSPIVGFLVAGVLAGPHTLSLVSDVDSVEMLAEIGVMLLLFSLGLEISFDKLVQVRHIVLASGPVQVLITIAAVSTVVFYFGVPLHQSIFLGFLLALSSTAIVVKMLTERREIDAIHGRVALGVLIFQDLSVLPMMILIPLLAGESLNAVGVLLALGEAFLIIGAVVVIARFIFPVILEQIVGTRSKELFVIAAIVLFLGTAWVASEGGFSLALGSFLAGLMLSGSEYSQQVFADIRPFRDGLNGLFFISVGMLVNPAFLWANLEWMLVVVISVLLIRSLILAGTVLLTGFSVPVAFIVALAMAQIGEFSFILLEAGSAAGLVGPNWYQIIISVAVATMVLTPFLFSLSRRLTASRLITKWLRLPKQTEAIKELDNAKEVLHDHVILCGFGASGRNLARVLKAQEIPYVILELDSQTVRKERKNLEPIYFGDGTDPEILTHAGIRSARVIIFAISDPFSTRRAVRLARSMNQDIVILIRTRYISEIDQLYELGATEVVAEEFEASLELLTRTMRVYHLPRELVRLEIRTIREGRYGVFRRSEATVPRLRLSGDMDVFTESVEVGNQSPLCHTEIAQSGFRGRSGALILGIIRNGQTINNPEATEVIRPGDLLVLTDLPPGTRSTLC